MATAKLQLSYSRHKFLCIKTENESINSNREMYFALFNSYIQQPSSTIDIKFSNDKRKGI